MAKAPKKKDLPEDKSTSENTADNAQNVPEGGEGAPLNLSTAGESGVISGDGSSEDKPTDDHQGQWASVRVVNSPYETRRRAGFVFTREPQQIDLSTLTHEQLNALDGDNCLEIKPVEAVVPSEDA
ncbi:HI1506-related protein [Providencia rettgeri]|uniref:HI1506-related protein n=1 Tax=Providencia rettgeri TaxID=587 RepID=UPI001F03ACFC|nr:HI1506-related protein [Providencia rettgeri]MCG9951659.1 HI1506-related protein [Providencia rettgeri]